MNHVTAGSVKAREGLAFNSMKQLLIWSDDFLTGDPAIDEEHRKILMLASRASDLACEHENLSELLVVFGEFGKCMTLHFTHEEEKLAAIGDPNLERHRAEHRAMLEELKFIHERLTKNGVGWVFEEQALAVLNFMIGATVGHFLKVDSLVQHKA